MILNRKFYSKTGVIQNLWNLKQFRKFARDKVFKAFKLHKTEWPEKLYFYSSRLKMVPKFTGNIELLSHWKESKLCETLCPTQAIKVTAKAFSIDDRGCIACGLCVELAPPGVFELSNEILNLHRSS